jgi:hypothetical protein
VSRRQMRLSDSVRRSFCSRVFAQLNPKRTAWDWSCGKEAVGQTRKSQKPQRDSMVGATEAAVGVGKAREVFSRDGYSFELIVPMESSS